MVLVVVIAARLVVTATIDMGFVVVSIEVSTTAIMDKDQVITEVQLVDDC